MDEERLNSGMSLALVDYFRCPKGCAEVGLEGELGAEARVFRLGPDLTCYGRTTRGVSQTVINGDAPDLAGFVRTENSCCALPFDPNEVATNLRRERYVTAGPGNGGKSALAKLKRNAYYAVRPLLGVSIRKHLQRASLKGWEKKPFPRWPVDRSVDQMFEQLLAWQLEARGGGRTPFVWFWPEGMKSCVIMTHDVEEKTGLDFCPALMELDASFGIKSSFQFIPEGRYPTPRKLLNAIRANGFEVNVHDFNHDGHLYDSREVFRHRAAKINEYVKKFACLGFRAGVLYRNLEWYDAFEFSYDMSVPNVGHLDPQPGGCCTVMPYYVGKILELPLTTTQDYSLFNVIGDYSIDLWKNQMALIAKGHGLISFNVHPDYVIESRAFDVYKKLLAYLSEFCSENHAWFALPGEVDQWWRERSQMSIVTAADGKLRIEGPGKERARIAWARLEDGGLSFSVEGGR